ncbi:GNAT family N-acetyltransferase [Ekhidna sp. To15]|uniref:GNAT family N-acetyltransferase n=1 Tax=Ekhidna sp. To15 TaxID=3395267 RepID=UPI003F520832
MSEIVIKEIPPNFESQYKKLVLQALIDDHECFRISPDDDLDIPLLTLDDNCFTLGAFLEAKLIGVVTFKREGTNWEKLRHKGLLSRMIVSPKNRGKGIGKLLIQELIRKARKIEGIEQINLTVIPTNEKAKSLYEQFGFQTFASEQNAIKWKGRYFTEDQMVLKL